MQLAVTMLRLRCWPSVYCAGSEEGRGRSSEGDEGGSKTQGRYGASHGAREADRCSPSCKTGPAGEGVKEDGEDDEEGFWRQLTQKAERLAGAQTAPEVRRRPGEVTPETCRWPNDEP